MKRASINILTVVLAIELGLLPVVQQLHLTFASHLHVYSIEHGCYEDVPPAQAGTLLPTTNRLAQPAEPVLSRLPATTVGAFSPCTVANFVLPVFQSNRAIHPPLPVGITAHAVPPFLGLSNTLLSTLTRAPKHSPPTPS